MLMETALEIQNFQWNNWGQSTKPRSSKAVEKLNAACQPLQQSIQTTQPVKNGDVPDVAAEVTLSPIETERTAICIGREFTFG